MPAAAKVGSFGLVFGDVGPNHIRYGPSGMVMMSDSGDTAVEVESKSSGGGGRITLTASTSNLKSELSPNGILMLDATGSPTVELNRSGTLTVSGDLTLETGKVTVAAGGDLELSSGDLTVSGGGGVIVASGDLSVGGNALMVRGTMAGASTDLPTLTVRQSSLPTSTADVFRIQNNSGSTNYLRVASSGTVSAGGNVSVGGGLTAGGAVSVGGGLTVSGTLSTSTDAGSSTAVAVGERYRDNAVVAWGRVTSAGILTNDYGVASAVRNSTGNYTITLDASASLPGNLITTANAELDAAPTTAGASRLIYVDQAAPGGVSVNSFNIYITNGSFAAADNDFMFICTAR